jgi:hypothetical protein
MIEASLFSNASPSPVLILRCLRCKEFRALSDFPVCRTGTRGVARTCKACVKQKDVALRSTAKWRSDRDARRAAHEAYGAMRCGRCRIVRPINEFTPSARRSSGYSYQCHTCDRAYYRRNWLRRALSHIGASSRAEGITFNLTIDDLSMPDSCPVLGIPLELSEWGRSDNSPSLDRLVPSRGYVPGNVKVISFLANRLKSNCTDPAVFEAIARYLREGLVA